MFLPLWPALSLLVFISMSMPSDEAPVDAIIPVYGVVVEKGKEKSKANAVVRIGEPIILDCKSRDIKIVELRWIRSGHSIPEGQVKQIKEPNSIKLRIDKVSYHHQGVYECRVKDDSGTVTSALLKLDIKGGPVFGAGILPCSEPFASSYCQNGGKCWSGNDDGGNGVHCWCPPQYHGRNCEMAYTQQSPTMDMSGSTFSVGVLGGVLVFVCLMLVAVLVYLFYYVKRDRDERSDYGSESIRGMLLSGCETDGCQSLMTPISLSSVNITKVAPSIIGPRTKSLDSSYFGGNMKVNNNNEVNPLPSPTDSYRGACNIILFDNQLKRGKAKNSIGSSASDVYRCRVHSCDRDTIKLDNVPVKARKDSNVSSNTSRVTKSIEQVRRGLLQRIPAREDSITDPVSSLNKNLSDEAA